MTRQSCDKGRNTQGLQLAQQSRRIFDRTGKCVEARQKLGEPEQARKNVCWVLERWIDYVANIAARVQALAEPGAVLVTASVQRQIAGLFVAEERGTQTLKGVPEPTALFRSVIVQGRPGEWWAAAGRWTAPR